MRYYGKDWVLFAIYLLSTEKDVVSRNAIMRYVPIERVPQYLKDLKDENLITQPKRGFYKINKHGFLNFIEKQFNEKNIILTNNERRSLEKIFSNKLLPELILKFAPRAHLDVSPLEYIFCTLITLASAISFLKITKDDLLKQYDALKKVVEIDEVSNLLKAFNVTTALELIVRDEATFNQFIDLISILIANPTFKDKLRRFVSQEVQSLIDGLLGAIGCGIYLGLFLAMHHICANP